TSYARAEELAAKAQRPGTQQLALGNHGTLLGLRGDSAGGLSYLKRAVAIAETLHDDANRAVWLENMADIYIGQGDLAAAEKLNRSAAEIQAVNSDASEHV